jgi:hypothetical protein
LNSRFLIEFRPASTLCGDESMNANRKLIIVQPPPIKSIRISVTNLTRKEYFMSSPDSNMPAEMNWVDYCDSLSNAYFVERAKTVPPRIPAEKIPDHTAFVASVREAMRELT